MENEIFNLEYHKKRLILRALNHAGSIRHAAPKLGITETNLHLLKSKYGIRREGKVFYMPEHIRYATKKIKHNA